MSLVKVKGTYDVLSSEARRWQALETYVKAVFKKFNYQEIRTPIMEYSNVFHREDENSDMVTKETYNFEDKGGRMLTLRPEGTAGIIRSYIENKLYATNDLVKLWYMGPNFRYERPQKGRFRQFSQFGVEVVGAMDPYLDAEVIQLAYEIIKGLSLKGVSVKINSLGDKASKQNYMKVLKAFLEPKKDQLSPDSQARLDKNPLRILDSKDPVDKELLKDAPLPLDHLSDEAKLNFEKIQEALALAGVEYKIDKRLVRGLDYYSFVVFEIQADIEGFGSQNALGGGGRYNELVESLGGPSKPGVGFAFGMERLLDALELEGIKMVDEPKLDAYFITFDETSKKEAMKLQSLLRKENISVDLNYSGKAFKGQLKEALAQNAKFLLILGENELNMGKINVKNTKTEFQELIDIKDLVINLKEMLHHV
ncbi:histidine--tRNA ligase [Acholeplasma equirhinis]|uniref:histidine--tRNA ligase n=1 Tax=Acholeplasma equirhinis TaxID=555393 RepID=UPI00197A9FCD|nr:histidine--tRNA ligase [Acholeplasma equirhinis]MBN3490489.1 histidine--tRNA ligase [Acholeplasma equirhinis]